MLKIKGGVFFASPNCLKSFKPAKGEGSQKLPNDPIVLTHARHGFWEAPLTCLSFHMALETFQKLARFLRWPWTGPTISTPFPLMLHFLFFLIQPGGEAVKQGRSLEDLGPTFHVLECLPENGDF